MKEKMSEIEHKTTFVFEEDETDLEALKLKLEQTACEYGEADKAEQEESEGQSSDQEGNEVMPAPEGTVNEIEPGQESEPESEPESETEQETETGSESETEPESEPDPEPDPKKTKLDRKIRRAERRLSNFQRFCIQAVLFGLVIYVLFMHLIGFVTAPNDDMYPRIDSGDLVMFSRIDIEPKAQEIIYFIKNDTRYIAREIAVGGDTVEITREGAVMINGNTMIESNIFFETYPLEGFTEYPLTLKEGEFFVLVDRRGGSEDSRYYGPVYMDEIQGEVITVAKRTNI